MHWLTTPKRGNNPNRSGVITEAYRLIEQGETLVALGVTTVPVSSIPIPESLQSPILGEGKKGRQKDLNRLVERGIINKEELDASGVIKWLEGQKGIVMKSDLVDAVKGNYEQTIRPETKDMAGIPGVESGIGDRRINAHIDREKADTLEQLLSRKLDKQIDIEIPKQETLTDAQKDIARLGEAFQHKVAFVDIKGANINGFTLTTDPSTIYLDVKNASIL